jgi:hypothetical protein
MGKVTESIAQKLAMSLVVDAEQKREIVLYVPRIILSTGEEINRAHQTGLAVNWGSIGSEDPRIVQNNWYTAGRVTPQPGELVGHFLR